MYESQDTESTIKTPINIMKIRNKRSPKILRQKHNNKSSQYFQPHSPHCALWLPYCCPNANHSVAVRESSIIDEIGRCILNLCESYQQPRSAASWFMIHHDHTPNLLQKEQHLIWELAIQQQLVKVHLYIHHAKLVDTTIGSQPSVILHRVS